MATSSFTLADIEAWKASLVLMLARLNAEITVAPNPSTYRTLLIAAVADLTDLVVVVEKVRAKKNRDTVAVESARLTALIAAEDSIINA